MRPTRSRLVAAALAAVMLVQGCGAGWRRPPNLAPGALEPRQQVQVWQGRTALRWHAVIVAPNSISGIPFVRPTDCDSCRITVPRATVDSVQVGEPVTGFWNSFGLVMGILLIGCFLECPRGYD